MNKRSIIFFRYQPESFAGQLSDNEIAAIKAQIRHELEMEQPIVHVPTDVQVWHVDTEHTTPILQEEHV